MQESIQDTLNKIKTIVTPEIAENIHAVDCENVKKLVIDVHGLSAKTAKRTINNIVAVNRAGYEVQIIHGYNHGTAIKEMLQDKNRISSKRIKNRKGCKHNLGITNLEISPAV